MPWTQNNPKSNAALIHEAQDKEAKENAKKAAAKSKSE